MKKKHVFNLTAFGLIFPILFFGDLLEWKGTYFWYILIPFGLYFAYWVKKLKIVGAYFLISFILFAFQFLIKDIPITGVFGNFSCFLSL
ncbi:MAG: hypothetical protein ACP5JO_08920 [Candidatus Ratteibacteria bacterium]